MKNSTIAYVLCVISIVIAVLELFLSGLIMGVLSKIVWFLPFIALYFADKVKKHEDQKLGNKLIIFAIVVFVILIAINALSFFSMF